MKRAILVIVIVLSVANIASADIFGTGDNQFTIDFVNISGDASSANGTAIGSGTPSDSWYKAFTDPTNDYRMGIYEITNDQWNKFKASVGGTVTGSPSTAYSSSAYFTGTNVPTNGVSWYEGAQFVNYLNTSTGHQAAYKFTGTKGQSDYSLAVWESGDVGYDASNPFRNSDAYYFLPTEDEWVKAGYWNGTSLQTYATIGDLIPAAGVDTNYYNSGGQPWDVGSGSEELNGTFDMMGNVSEWMESPFFSGAYLSGYDRSIRGGSFYDFGGRTDNLRSSYRGQSNPYFEDVNVGFRVASVPEPCTLVLLSLGGLMLRRKR